MFASKGRNIKYYYLGNKEELIGKTGDTFRCNTIKLLQREPLSHNSFGLFSTIVIMLNLNISVLSRVCCRQAYNVVNIIENK